MVFVLLGVCFAFLFLISVWKEDTASNETGTSVLLYSIGVTGIILVVNLILKKVFTILSSRESHWTYTSFHINNAGKLTWI